MLLFASPTSTVKERERVAQYWSTSTCCKLLLGTHYFIIKSAHCNVVNRPVISEFHYTLHGYPINFVLGCIAAAPDPARD